MGFFLIVQPYTGKHFHPSIHLQVKPEDLLLLLYNKNTNTTPWKNIDIDMNSDRFSVETLLKILTNIAKMSEI